MSFFAVPLSGLNASQSALQSISSNLSNVDTDGYKDQNVTFSDIFADSGLANGARDPIQTGGGVETASTTTNFTSVAATSTGIDSNMAINGNGFFVVQRTDGSTAYSRAGDFTANNAGQLVAPDGSLVMGYPAANGVINSSASLQPLTVGTGLIEPATATTSFTANVNLDAQAAVGDTASSTINTYDSLGAPQVLTVNYTKSSTGNWGYTISVPSAALGTPGAGVSTTVASGTLTFDSSGKLTATTDGTGSTTTSKSGQPVSIAFSVPAFSDGAAAAPISWDLADANGNGLVTQAALASGTSQVTPNGNPAGTATKYTIEADGTIQATFPSGPSQTLGQVAVANVTNEQGLQQIGNNLFQATAGSGPAQVGIAGTGGRGTIQGGYVEGSNVNVANEFSKMIVAQQAYQANAKTVTAFNQVEQATIAMMQG